MAEDTTTTYLVTGMTCEHCVASVTEEIGVLGGVRAVDADLGSGRVTVTSHAAQSEDTIRAAVTEADCDLAS